MDVFITPDSSPLEIILIYIYICICIIYINDKYNVYIYIYTYLHYPMFVKWNASTYFPLPASSPPLRWSDRFRRQRRVWRKDQTWMKDTTAMAGEWWFQGHEMLDLSIYLSIHPSIYLTYPKFSMSYNGCSFSTPLNPTKNPPLQTHPAILTNPPWWYLPGGQRTGKDAAFPRIRFIEGTLS